MTMAGTSYPVSKSTGTCAATGRPFAPAERYVATLIERDNADGLERRDYSVQAWESGHRPAAPERLFASWRAEYHEHPAARRPLLGDDELLDLFEQLGEATAAKQISFRYVLSLLLARRRILRVVGSRPRRADEPAALLVITKGQDPASPTAVIDPGLDDGALADVIEQIGAVLPGADPAPAA